MADDVPEFTAPSLADALIPLLTLAALIAGALTLFGLDALDGPIQVALVVCCEVAALIAIRTGTPSPRSRRPGSGPWRR